MMAVGILAALLVWHLTHQTPPPKVGAPAPAFSLPRLDGSGDVSLASFRGKTVVLNFFASWCAPCKREAPDLESLWRQYRSDGVVVLGVDSGDARGDARRFLGAHGVTYPIVFDPDEKLAQGPVRGPGASRDVRDQSGRTGRRHARARTRQRLGVQPGVHARADGGEDRMTRRLKGTAQIVALACVAGLLALLVWQLANQQHAPRVGSVAPAFTLHRLEGPGKVSLASYRGKPVVLNFWASWCEPCKSEAAVLQRDWSNYRNRGVVFLGVDYHDLASDGRRFVSAHALTFPMLEDGSGKVTGDYGISQVPETYVLNRQGKVVAHLAGPITDPRFAAEFRDALVKARA